MGSGSERGPIYSAKETTAHKYVLRARLAGVAKPRRLTTHFFWAQENRDLIKALKEEGNEEEEIATKKSTKRKTRQRKKRELEGDPADDEAGGEEPVERKNANGLANYQALCKSEFEKLDQEEQKEWKELAELDLAEKSERYTAVTKAQSMTTSPEMRQQ